MTHSRKLKLQLDNDSLGSLLNDGYENALEMPRTENMI